MRPPPRPFRISDALVLVAATGIGLAGCRFWLSASEAARDGLWPTGDESLVVSLRITARWALPISSILLLSWTTAILMLRLRAPRPRRGRLWCQPGFLAGVAAVSVVTWKAVAIGLLAVTQSLLARSASLSWDTYWGKVRGLSGLLLGSSFPSQLNFGGAILLVWLVTWASGRCRPEPSWIDRTGRALGSASVCVSLFAASLWLG